VEDVPQAWKLAVNSMGGSYCVRSMSKKLIVVELYQSNANDIGKTDLVEHRIVLEDDRPFKQPYRKIPPGMYDEIRQHIKDMLEAGGSKFFSKLDLRSGYWQVAVAEEDKPKTAFSVGNLGFYECNRMSFSLTNAPATFQRLMEKCHVVGENGISADPEKLSAVKEWRTPQNIKELRQFLGFSGYYRRFIKNYSQIVQPLNSLLQGHSTTRKVKKKHEVPAWKWQTIHQTAFETIKELLTQPPVLAYADYSKPFIIHTDSSSHGLGAVLYQRQDGVDKNFPSDEITATDMSDIDWKKEQREDKTIARVIEIFNQGEKGRKETTTVQKYLRERTKLQIIDDTLYRNSFLDGEKIIQLCLPDHFKDVVFIGIHKEVGHPGIEKTIWLAKQRFYYPGLEQDIKARVENCERCIRSKTPVRPRANLHPITSTKPLEILCIDFLSLEKCKGGFENILVITDHFTRYACAVPLKNQLATTTAKALYENFIVHYSFPDQLHSD
ncbi:uncharacterized protein K02A2.6-like, partial [Saccostrea cucullata]|uniref:uncharacterized protein K02A2.6-like n=1 Tax=Saccostrea cuccullata TaxID=36930 RepID=UPI002ED0FBF8